MLTSEQIGSLNQLLGFALESLDIPPELQARATAVYDALGQWVLEHDAHAGRREPDFFPQGSAALGTATMDDDWDIDAVYQRQIARASITQELLKSRRVRCSWGSRRISVGSASRCRGSSSATDAGAWSTRGSTLTPYPLSRMTSTTSEAPGC